MLIAVISVVAIMVVFSLALVAQGRWTWQALPWIVVISIIPIAVNYLWWRRPYAKAPLLPLLYLDLTQTEWIVLLLILVPLMVLGLASAVLLVMRKL